MPMRISVTKFASPAVYLCGLASILLGGTTAHAAAPGAPNVIIINLDDVAWGMVEPYLNHLSAESKLDSDPTNDFETDYFGFNIDQPGIQRLANDGIMMMDGYSSSPVCWPSRTGLLSGQFPARWANGNKVPGRYTTIAEYLQDDGYATMCIGKWQGLEAWYKDGGTQTSKDVDQHPMNRGFDEFFGFGWGSHTYWNLDYDGTTNYDSNGNLLPRELNEIYKNWDVATEADLLSGGVYNPPNPESHPDPWYLTHELTAQAVDFIERKKDQPFFIYMPYHAKHTPVEIPASYGPFNTSKEAGGRLVDAVDIGITDIIQKLEEHNLYDNTLFIFTSDNGGNSFFNDGLLRGRKSNLYEGGVRVPYIITWPAQLTAGSVSHEIISNTDMLPTVLGAAGISTSDTFDGNNFMPYLLGQTSQGPNQRLFWGINNVNTSGSVAMRDGDWKYLRYGGEWQLYDLSVDPLETNNLINVRTDIVNQLDPVLQDWQSQMAGGGGGDPEPDPDPVFTEVNLYLEDFNAGENFSDLEQANGLGEIVIPTSGNVVAKESFNPNLSFSGAEEIRIDAKIQVSSAIVNAPGVSVRVKFNTASGPNTVNGDTLSLSSSAVGQFVDYASTILVPADAIDIIDLRIRVDSGTLASTPQLLYVDDLSLTGLVPSTGNPAPAVSISAPSDATVYTIGDVITVTVFASDGTGEVVDVQLLANGTVFATDDEAPYSFDLSSLSDGSYTLEAVAYDDEDASTISDSVEITILPSTTGPVVFREAETFIPDPFSDIGVYDLPGGAGQKIGSLENGTWAEYASVDFGSGPVSFDASVASKKVGGKITLHIDSLSAPAFGEVDVPKTGPNYDNFVTVTGTIDSNVPVSGVHNVYLLFTGTASGSLFDVDWFEIETAVAPAIALYSEDFELGENYSYVTRLNLGGNYVARINVPASGSVNAKDNLGGPSGLIPLNGATQLSLEADLQLEADEVGSVNFRMFVRFNMSAAAGGGVIDVESGILDLNNSFVGQFLGFQDTISVPAGAESINYIRMRVDQDVQGSATQFLYSDNVRVIALD